jgi:hypothetical protein
MNEALLKGQKHLTWLNGMKPSILTTILSSAETLLTSLNTVYSASLLRFIFYITASVFSLFYTRLIYCGDYIPTTGTIVCTL